MIRYINSAGQKIACQSYSGQGVGVFYIGGHKTVMSGGLKCEPIRDFCIERNVPFVAFDLLGGAYLAMIVANGRLISGLRMLLMFLIKSLIHRLY